VNFDPSPEERALVCHRGTFYGDLSSCLTTNVPIVDERELNLSRIRTQGNDLAVKYAVTTSVGEFDFGLDGTYLSRFAEAFTDASPMINEVNTDHNPLKIKAQASVGWRLGPLEAATSLHYAGHYEDIDSVPARSVAAWTTIDAQVSYEFRNPPESALSDLRLTVSVQNLLGSDPPFLNNVGAGVGWDQENATPFGREVTFALRKRW
jgi:iron complex outermembrane receptor protein